MTDYVYEIYDHTMIKVKVSSDGDIIYQKMSKGTPNRPKYVNKGDLKILRKDRNIVYK